MTQPCDRTRKRNGGPADIGRRSVLQATLTTAALLGLGAVAPGAAATRQGGGTSVAPPASALALARFLNNVPYRELPPKAIEHAKMILASTFASAAPGALIDSARILRDLAKEQGGKPEAPIWFDGTRLPVREAARVNAALSDAAASDDSDIRNTAHEGTTLTSAGLAVAARVGRHQLVQQGLMALLDVGPSVIGG